MAKIFIPRKGSTTAAAAVFKRLKAGVFRTGKIKVPIGLPSRLGGFQTLKSEPIKLGLPQGVIKPFRPGSGFVPPSIKTQPKLISAPAKIKGKPIQKTSGVLQSGGTGEGRLKNSVSLFTSEGKLNIPLIALGIAAAGLLLRK